MFVLLFLSFLNASYAGTILPGIPAIKNTIANKAQVSDYTFNLIPQTTVPSGGVITINFPIQYTAGLGITSVVAGSCNYACSINNNVVSLYFSKDILATVLLEITINGVLNPANQGGTGNFIVRTQRYQYVYDENLIFAVIGIADTIDLLSSTNVQPDLVSGTYKAGKPSKYNFAFKTNVNLPLGTQIKLGIPLTSGFEVSDIPGCELYAINNVIIAGVAKCKKEGNQVVVSGFETDIGAGKEVGISVTITNPPSSVITNKFTIAAFRNNTSVIYTWRNDVNGIQITPGDISAVQLTTFISGQIQSLGKVMDYQLSFLPSNPLPDGSVIRIDFPVTFQIVSGTAYDYVFTNQGLEDVDETNALQITVQPFYIQLSGFAAIAKPSTIIVTFRAINPSNPGWTSALQIRTYVDASLSNVIDENTDDAVTKIQNIPSLSPTSVTATNTMSQTHSTDITFTITPSVFVSGGAIIKILIASEFTLGPIKSTNCISKVVGTVTSNTCTRSDNLITMSNPSSVQFNVASNSQFSLNGFIQTPIYAKTYLINVDLYQSDGTTILLSYNDYLTITPQVLSSTSGYLIGTEVSILPNNKKFSILNVEFMNLIEIPQGSYVTKNTELQGRIEVIFGAPGEWDNKLGTSLSDGDIIPCKAIFGIIPIFGKRIQCNIYLGDTITKAPKVVMRNFDQVPSQTQMIIHIPKLLNPVAIGTTTITINVVQYDNRWRTVLNSAGIAISMVAQAGAIYGTTTVPMGISSFDLNGIFDLDFEPKLGNDLDPNSYLLVKLPGYDTMFVPPEETIICYVDLFITPCIQYTGIDWILIKTENLQKHYYALKPYLRILNLVWPRYADSVGFVEWSLIDGVSLVELEYKTLGYGAGNSQFPPPLINDFLSSVIRSPIKGEGFVGVEFEFQFTATDLIPQGGTVILTFPLEFSLEASFPQVQIECPQFTGNLQISTTGNKLTVANIDEFPAGAPFNILVGGLKTPGSPPSPQAIGWQIETQYNGKPINTRSTFDDFTYGSKYQPGTVIFQSITAFPNNELEIAVYSFSFVLPSALGVGGEIIIEFPQEYYPDLPHTPELATCKLSGGLNSFYSCIQVSNTYVIVIDQIYLSGIITFDINNIQNPQRGITEGFQIRTRYDNQYLDITDLLNIKLRTVEIMPQANPILIQQLDFDPRNEGEISTYRFQFISSTPIQSSVLFIVISFPSQYDPLLGEKVKCTSTYSIVCAVIDRQVWVEGITDYQPSGTNPLVLHVSGVVNPNYNQNDFVASVFAIGTILQNSFNYIDYNSDIGSLRISKAPGWAYLYNVILTNTFSRVQSDYTFNFTSIRGIPPVDSKGFIIVDFPKQFDIPDEDIRCSPYVSSSYTNNFATTLACSFKDSSAYITGNELLAKGIIIFNLTNVLNPEDEVTSNNLQIKIYDGFKKEISERSYPNLDPWTFSYRFPGPLISINGEQPIVVEAGTQTQDLWFTVDYPCALNLTFTPANIPFTLIPSKVKLMLTDLKSKFRVSVPESLPAGNYYITWMSDAPTPIYYTPVKKSLVRVTNVRNIRIDVTSLTEIPIGDLGQSLEQLITVDYAPDLGIEIVLRPLTKTISVVPTTIVIPRGWNNATYRVFSNATEYYNQLSTGEDRTDNRQLALSLEGINKNVYVLSSTILTVTFIPISKEVPFISSMIPFSTTQTTTLVQFGASTISIIYYMVALIGTDKPTVEELVNAGPPTLNTTLSRYFKVSIGIENQENVILTRLLAQTPYIIYALAQDRNGLFSDIKNVIFSTLNRFNASILSVAFNQNYLNGAEKDNIRNYIAFVLSLPVSKVVEFIDPVQATSGGEQKTSLSLNIISIPTSENFDSPLNLVQVLQSRRQWLSTLLPSFDALQTLKGREYEPYVPQFVSQPINSEATYYTCGVSASLDRLGYIFIIATEAATDKQKPKAIQVWWGYDNHNEQKPSAWVQVTQTFSPFNLTISTVYHINQISEPIPKYRLQHLYDNRISTPRIP